MGKLNSALAGIGMLAAASNPALAEERQDVATTGGIKAPVVELSEETLSQITADYSACIDELITDIKEFKADESILQEDIDFFEEDGQAHCANMAESSQKIAEIQIAGEQKRAEIRANADAQVAKSNARVNAILAEIFEGAKREQGL